mmetsp:Transcript_65829/g.175322  ORF Transcript_65829/g.175322 Transcript_65829/m.175322 type:complete len:268 (+) Transcript_65829:159-962(+)
MQTVFSPIEPSSTRLGPAAIQEALVHLMRVARQDPREEAMDLVMRFWEFVVVRLLLVRLNRQLPDCIHEGFAIEEAMNTTAVGAMAARALRTLEDLDNVQPRQEIGHDLQLLAHEQELVGGHVVAPVLDDGRPVCVNVCVLRLRLHCTAHGQAEALQRAVGREEHVVLVHTRGRRAPRAAQPALRGQLGRRVGALRLRRLLLPRPLPRRVEAAPSISLGVLVRRGGVALLLVLLLLKLAQGKGRQHGAPVWHWALCPGGTEAATPLR